MSKKKILIVEDDLAICSMYKTKFEVDGYEVATADNGADSLKMVSSFKPDLIMLDIILPGLDGFAILEKLKKDNSIKNTKIIMLTNLGTEEDRQKGLKMGATDYLVKADLTPAQISDKIKKYLK